MLELIKKLIPRRCPVCGRIRFGVVDRRQNTTYQYDPDNYIKCCSRCIKNVNADWDDLWREYNMSLGV